MCSFRYIMSVAAFSVALLSIPVSAHAGEKERRQAVDGYNRYSALAALPADKAKKAAVLKYRKYFSEHPYRKDREFCKKSWEESVALLQKDGTFSDLSDADAGKPSKENNANSGGCITEALKRVWCIVDRFRTGEKPLSVNAEIWDRCQKAILHYGGLEISRPNVAGRFHDSCFSIPTAAVNIYFCMLDLMNDVEEGRTTDKQLKEVCDMLKILGLQAWTQPYRNDYTDDNVVSVERFRNHVWWVGGNALGYRSLLPVAFMMRSVPMVDVLSEVCQKAIDVTSQATYDTSFWNEGFTADGAGWGHGRQCLIWGYPVDGTLNALNVLSILKGSPWNKKLSRDNIDALMGYFRGANYYYYKGYNLPCLDRTSMLYRDKPTVIRYSAMLKQLVNEWSDSFTRDELAELKALYGETKDCAVSMEKYGNTYNGTRWFFNNDDLIKKNDDYHIIVNMASVRCDGLESATYNDEYNFYTADGSTLLQRTGHDYNKAFGAFDVTAFPGVTAREGMDRLEPVTNWRGYCSKHNFAAASTFGGDNAVAGYIFEKMNASDKAGVNDCGNNQGKNPMIYGVKAYKSYFMLGDYMVALGAGVTNLNPGIEGNIRTSIEQTEKTGRIYEYKGNNNISWMVHEGKFAYSAFPEYKDRTHYVTETRKTDWNKMNKSNYKISGLPEKVDIFQMWIDHGRKVSGDTYGYAVYAGKGLPDKEYPFDVLRNDTSVQAVSSKDGKTVEAVFYNPKSVLTAKGLSLSVSSACTVLVEDDEDGTAVSVTDATMNPECKQITVTYNGRKIVCNMPQGKFTGKPAVVKLSKGLSYWLGTPARDWESETMPIGNGSIGANIYGGISEERITFNEKSLWRGGPNTPGGADYYWNVNKNSAHVLKDIRQAFLDGDTERASYLTRKNFNGLAEYEPDDENPFRFGNFTTAGEFLINTGIGSWGVTEYRRTLSLDSSLVTVRFKQDGIVYHREYFASYPDNVMAFRFGADVKGCQNLKFAYHPNPESTGEFKIDGQNGFQYVGHLDNNGMKYVVRVKAIVTGGTVSCSGDMISVSGADEVVYLVTADTDYKMNFNPDFENPETYIGIDPEKTTSEWMDVAMSKGYGNLYDTHLRDYSSIFGRVSLDLNPDIAAVDMPMDERLELYRNSNDDFYLEELYYQFGRYLLISSSRKGNLPANLQGIWSNGVDGPWRVDYHNNINLQMNYWPACMANLEECMPPLVDFIRTLVKPGEKVAQAYYDARGWTTSISSNIFGFASPLSKEYMTWNLCPIAGPWLATHVWDYYDYTRNLDFLKSVGYDLIKSSAQFTVDYLWRRPDGLYTAAPSTSPEHGPVDEGATFVHAVAREILMDAIAASEILGVDSKERKEWKKVLDNIVPYRIGRYGQLMEWSKDIDDPSDTHRHVNHLFGLHPGRTVSPVTTPELAEASKVVLNHRGDEATGWSMGWKLNQWARLHDGNRAYKLYANLLKYGTVNNLWDTHPPFQIDGNFGGVSGVTEMLLQSHLGFIHLLPALPDAWKDGKVEGIRARGNFEIGMEWEGGTLKAATVFSESGTSCTLRYGEVTISFDTKPGETYKVLYDDFGKLNISTD